VTTAPSGTKRRQQVVVSTFLRATPHDVWQILEPIERHVDWMADAESITFDTSQTRGAGTAFTCITKIGPIRLADRMTITEWEPGRSMGVVHNGLVRGEGRFTLEPERDGTRFVWSEHLTFPWWLVGPVGAAVAGPLVLAPLWRGNLRRLAAIVDASRENSADTWHN
jgi:carbon monoxide dehydrogenase subunit G